MDYRVRRTFFPSGWCFFYLVTTGWIFDISLRIQSINQSQMLKIFESEVNLTSKTTIFNAQYFFQRQKDDVNNLIILRVVPMTTPLDRTADIIISIF